MNARALLLLILICMPSLGCSRLGIPDGRERRIALVNLEDKIKGGWAGQMIGVSYGAPTEFTRLGKMVEGDIAWNLTSIDNAIDQDDCYVEMTFAEVMDRIGLDATTEQYGEAFKNSQYELWHANAGARRLLNRGLKAPLSGQPEHNIHANDIDFQIESDFIGLMCPGLPIESNKYCDRVGRVMNSGDGLYGGMFVCGMYTAAFFENDPNKIVAQGLACMPPESGYAALIRDVIAFHRERPDDWKYAWAKLNEKWDKDDPCPDGALHPFNIDARLNGGYIAIGMLYGNGDFDKSLEITTRCGQDSDCNPSNVGGILGTMLGYNGYDGQRRIPDKWKAGFGKIANSKFSYTNYSFEDITRSTLERAKKVIVANGGTITQDQAIVRTQRPRPPKLEQWDMGKPERIIRIDESDWAWRGNWEERRDEKSGRLLRRVASSSGAEATLKFSGTAIAVVAHHNQDGGRADVYLDGKKVGEIDAYIVPRTSDNDLWHAYGLTHGPHTLRIVATGAADPRSKGHQIPIDKAIIYVPK